MENYNRHNLKQINKFSFIRDGKTNNENRRMKKKTNLLGESHEMYGKVKRVSSGMKLIENNVIERWTRIIE